MNRPTPALLCLVLLGCGSIGDPEPGPPEDRGQLLSSGTDISYLTWVPDASELVFIGNYYHLMAVTVAGGSMRTLYSSVTSIGNLRVAGANAYVWVSALGGPGFRLVRIPLGGGAADTLISVTGLGTFQFAISSDERFVAFGDTLYDLTTATKRATFTTGFPWAFSPDGSQLLWETAFGTGPTQLRAIATADGSVQNLVRPPDIVRHDFAMGVHYWSGNDPIVLHVPYLPGAHRTKTFLMNARTGADREVADIDADQGLTLGDVSADGTRAVVWTGPYPLYTQLFSIDASTGDYEPRATVSARGNSHVGYVKLSPDKTRVAYVVNDSITFGTSGVPKLYLVNVGQ